jgi:hypothetical protein
VTGRVSWGARAAAVAVGIGGVGSLAVAVEALGFVASIWPRDGVSPMGEASVLGALLAIVLVPVGLAAGGTALGLFWAIRYMPGAPRWWRRA